MSDHQGRISPIITTAIGWFTLQSQAPRSEIPSYTSNALNLNSSTSSLSLSLSLKTESSLSNLRTRVALDGAWTQKEENERGLERLLSLPMGLSLFFVCLLPLKSEMRNVCGYRALSDA